MNSLQLAVTRCNVVKHGTISSEPEVTCQGLGCRKWDRVKLPDTRRSRKKQIGKKKKARGAGLLKHPIQIVDQDGNYRVFFLYLGFTLSSAVGNIFRLDSLLLALIRWLLLIVLCFPGFGYESRCTGLFFGFAGLGAMVTGFYTEFCGFVLCFCYVLFFLRLPWIGNSCSQWTGRVINAWTRLPFACACRFCVCVSYFYF